MAGILTNAQLRAQLPEGITLSGTTYPDAESCLAAVTDFLSATEKAQVAQNADAPTGEDVSLISVGVGAIQTKSVGDPPTPKQVRLVTRSITNYEEVVPGPAFPVLV